MRFDAKHQKILVVILILLASMWLIYRVRGILFPFLLGGILAYLVNPLIIKLLGRGFTRTGAIVLLLGMLLTVSLIFGVFGLPLIVEELTRLSATIPSYVSNFEKTLDGLYLDLERVKLPALAKQVVDQALNKAEKVGVDSLNYGTTLILNFLSQMPMLVMVPIIAFYILKDWETLAKSTEGLVPKKYRKEMFQLMVEINGVLSGFMRGQFLVSLFIAFFSTLGLVLLKVNFAVVLGIIAGIFNIIPFLGPILGAVPAVVITLIKSPLRAVAVVILFFVIQQVESGIISPRIVGDKVGLHPLTVIFSILAGGQIGGAVGMILAVPTAAIVKILLNFISQKLAD